MRYILIPVEDIDNRIKELFEDLRVAANNRTEKGKEQFLRASSKISEIENITFNRKQISMDENMPVSFTGIAVCTIL